MSAVLPRRPLAGRSDAALVELISEGDDEAFEALVRRYWRELLIYSDRLLGAEGRAEDACQQALLQAWLALRAGTEVDDVRPWLYRIVHNSAVTILRRAHHETVELNEALDSPASDATADSRIILGEIFDRLSAMPEPQREAIVMTAVRGRSHAETAAKLGLTDGAVRGLVYRARASLRSAVAGLLPVGLMNWWGRAGSRHVSLAGDASDAAGAAGAAGSAGLAAAVVKGGAVLAAAGALAGTGTVVGSIVSSAGHRPPAHVRRPARPAAPTRHTVVGTRRAALSAGPAVIAVDSRRSDRSDRSETERARHRGQRGPETSRGGPGPSSNERGGESGQGVDGGGQNGGRGQGPSGPGKTGGGGGRGSGSGGGSGGGPGSGSGGGSGSGSGSGSGGGPGPNSGEH